jgi:hypothetical protein
VGGGGGGCRRRAAAPARRRAREVERQCKCGCVNARGSALGAQGRASSRGGGMASESRC